MALQAWLRPYLDQGGLDRIEAAVRKAERRTRGEVVPVLARRSAPGGHVPWLLALLAFFVLEAAGAGLWDRVLPWGSPVPGRFLDLLAAGALGLLLGRLALFLRLLTPARDLERAVHLSAEAAFYRLGLRKTRESTGVLLYVSLAEHRAVVLADEGIAKRVPAETWDAVCADLLKGAAARDLAAGFEDAVARCAGILAKPFPPRRRNPNELADRLRVIG